jgi:hypothetical protein
MTGFPVFYLIWNGRQCLNDVPLDVVVVESTIGKGPVTSGIGERDEYGVLRDQLESCIVAAPTGWDGQRLGKRGAAEEPVGNGEEGSKACRRSGTVGGVAMPPLSSLSFGNGGCWVLR